MAAELGAGVVGFAVAVRLARRLGPEGFAHWEYASAVAAWLLVVVRGGVETIVHREAARRPRLIRPLTEILLGLKLAAAVVAGVAVLALAATCGTERGAAVAVAGLILIPSALAADVAPKARGRLKGIAAAQGLRAVGYAVAAWALVWGQGQSARAAACAGMAEIVACLVLLVLHAREFGLPRPRFRRRAWVVLARRGAVASLIRFGRVSLYGADVLVLGWWAGAELGPYAAARRVVFALVAIGVVIPGAVAPTIARAWAEGPDRAREAIGRATAGLLTLALPAAVGLALTSGRWMPWLFGPEYRAGGLWLALIAVRLPWLLVATSHQAALIACRREAEALRLVLGLSVLAAVTVPIAAARGGPAGVGGTALVLEVLGTLGGWLLLRRWNAAPPWHHHGTPAALGCLTLAAACWALNSQPLGVIVPAAAALFAATWGIATKWRRRAIGLTSNHIQK